MKKILKLNSVEEHSIYVELEVEPICSVYEKKEINLIQDLYSPSTNLEFSQKKILAITEKKEMSRNFEIKGTTNISGLEEGNLLDVETIPVVENTKITNSKITYEGKINLNFIYANGNTLNSVTSEIPFEVSDENTYNISEINVETDLGIGNTSYEVKSGEKVDYEISLQAFTKTSKNVSINIIDDINEVEKENIEDDYDSLILYIVVEGDSLWKIAKKFNSTVEDLVRLNGIEDENNLTIGQKIYIPKFNYIKKEQTENAKPEAIV